MLGAMVNFDSILKRTLNFHIVPFALPYASLINELTIRTLGSKEFIRINVYDVKETEVLCTDDTTFLIESLSLKILLVIFNKDHNFQRGIEVKDTRSF